MVIAIVFVILVLGSVIFHWVTPWWLTPLASNWGTMDDTLSITVAITGLFFVVINLFVVYTLWRFRHRPGLKAAYEPENHKLERWLIGITTVGIVALLAPGLWVYADYVQPPRDAMQVEVVGQQWQWRYRFPGPDGKLGGSDARFVNGTNPLGIDPADPAGQDDLIVNANELHLPLDRPVKVLLRSHDSLHDFFVPQFRARMNIVPGQVSSFWFTPTRAGRFEAMCAQLCGVGHPDMRGFVVIEDEAAFVSWQQGLPSFARTLAPAAVTATAGANPLVETGRTLGQTKGCVACHTVDGGSGVGPTWKGLFGKTETLTDGSQVLVDETFVREFILNPQARHIKGYPPVMPKIELSEEELSALVAYIKSLGVARQ
jgi:cytochrome c oxidase subunit II